MVQNSDKSWFLAGLQFMLNLKSLLIIIRESSINIVDEMRKSKMPQQTKEYYATSICASCDVV
jgi:hypothetical protein